MLPLSSTTPIPILLAELSKPSAFMRNQWQTRGKKCDKEGGGLGKEGCEEKFGRKCRRRSFRYPDDSPFNPAHVLRVSSTINPSQLILSALLLPDPGVDDPHK